MFIIIPLITTNVSFADVTGGDFAYYRAPNGTRADIYVVSMPKEEQKKIINRKVNVWTSLMRCEPMEKITFLDPLFVNDKAIFSIDESCTLSIDTEFFKNKCPSDVLEIIDVIDSYKDDAAIGYGVEYISPQEQYYINKICK